MKVNLPSKSKNNSKKIISLSLLGLATNGVEAGQAFKNCLIVDRITGIYPDIYNSLINFPFNNYGVNITNGASLWVCCEKSSGCFSEGSPCSNAQRVIYCQKTLQDVSCEANVLMCGGIIGDAKITADYTSGGSSCPDLRVISNDLMKNNIDFYQGYTAWRCTNCKVSDENDNNFRCYWDNSGWTCFNCFCSASSAPCANYCCTLQWPAPFPNVIVSSSTSSSTTSTSNSVTFTSNSTYYTPASITSPHLTKKIAIPIGTIIGVATVGGVTYYLYKKKKQQQSEQREMVIAGPREDNTMTANVPGTESINQQLKTENDNLRQQLAELQAQIEIPPK